MTTDQAPAPARNQTTGPPRAERPDALPPADKAATKDVQDDASRNETAPDDRSDGAGADSEDGPSGTRLIATLLTSAGEIAASEHALADATFAFQINNLATGADATLRSESVGTNTLYRVRRTFVTPESLERAWNILGDHHLLLLRGAPGDGRLHLATFLLDAFCDARVRRIDGGSLAGLSASDLTIGGGHLWPGPIDDQFDQRAAETLAEKLRKLPGHMIVLWPTGVDCPPELGEFVAEPGRPDLGEVLRRHLTASAKPLLAEDRVAAVRDRLSGARHAGRLARLLNQVAAGQKPLDVALAEADGPVLGIPDWFADLPERQDQAFALALTALDDLSLPSVVAGARLADELIQRSEDPDGRCGLRPFQRPTKALLVAVGAQCVPSFRETGYGRVPITAVRLRRRRAAREMLDAFWLSFPYLQDIYLEWLNTLARHRDEYVRERVALAAGLLARCDFDFILGRLLRGWAGDADPKLRRAAATALRPPASGDDLREIVWGLLNQWATSSEYGDDSLLHRRLTAVSALGGPVGAGDPERALDLIGQRFLPRDTTETDYSLWTAVAFAVTELFGDGGGPASDAVLRRAASWSETKQAGPVAVAIAVLLGVVGKPVDQAHGENRTAPPLLRATGRSRGNLNNAAVLWRLAISEPKFAADAMCGLRMLAQSVGVDGVRGDELTDLVAAMPNTVRERRTLRYEVRRWTADQDNAGPPISRRLQEALSGGEDR